MEDSLFDVVVYGSVNDDDNDDAKDILSDDNPVYRHVIKNVDLSPLKSTVEKLTKLLSDIKAVGSFELDEVEVKAEITGEGKVKIFGSSVGVEANTGLTLKFKRKKSEVEEIGSDD